MPMLFPLFGQTKRARKSSSFVIVLALALALSQTLSASLVQALTIDEISQGSVLGDTTYPSVKLTSSTNKSLTVTATPISFSSGQWSYKFDWTRVRNVQGSLYITLKSNKSTEILGIDTAAKTGSQTAQLDPLTSYRFEFFSQTNGNGSVLLRKFFTTMGDPSDTSSSNGSGSTASTGTGTMTGSYDPAVDKETTDRFYVYPTSRIKVPGRPAFFTARFGAPNAIEGLAPLTGAAMYQDNYFFYVDGLPTGAVAWYYLDGGNSATKFPNVNWGDKMDIGGISTYFDWDWTRPKIPYVDGLLYDINRAHPEFDVRASNDYNQTRERNFPTGYPTNQVPLYITAGQNVVIGIQNTPDFKGKGVYTLTGVLTKRKVNKTTGVATPEVIKKVTFSVDMGDPVQQCLDVTKNRLSGNTADFTKPVAKSSNLYTPKFVINDATLWGFTDACDPSIAQYDGGIITYKQITKSDPNFATLKVKMEQCAQKAKSQADRLGIGMKCYVKNFSGAIEAGFGSENSSAAIDSTGGYAGYWAPVCNTTTSGMPYVDWFAVNLVGTGYTNSHLSAGVNGSWKHVELVDRFVAMEGKWGLNHGGYWDIDAGAYREGNINTAYSVPPVCDTVMSVYAKKSNGPEDSGILGGESTGDNLTALTGQKAIIYAQAPAKVKSATLYLMKNYQIYPSPADRFYAGSFSVFKNQLVNGLGSANVVSQSYKWQTPAVAQRIGTVYFDANGKASYDWIIPDLGPEFGSAGYTSLTSLMEQIRMVADNGMWTDSMHFKIKKDIKEDPNTASQSCANPQADGSCGSPNERAPDLYDSMSVATSNGKYISRTFKGPSAAVVDPNTFNVADNFEAIWSAWTWSKLNPEYQKTFKPGDTVKLYAWTQNLYTSKVDLAIADNNYNCQPDYSQDPNGVNKNCISNYQTQSNRAVLTIATDVPAVKVPADYGNKWILTYTFTIPKDLPNGSYQIRMIDPDYMYGFLGKSRTDDTVLYSSGVALSSAFKVAGSTSNTSPLVSSSNAPKSLWLYTNNQYAGKCGEVEVKWEANNVATYDVHYNVYRAKINDVTKAEKIISDKSYVIPGLDGYSSDFTDKNLPGGTYYYWVENIGATTPQKVAALNNGIKVEACK